MRWKIVLVNGGIVLVLALVTFFLLRTSLSSVVADPREQKGELVRAIHAAEARLTLDSLQTERWLARHAASPEVKNVFEAGTASARSDSATSKANELRDLAVASGDFSRMAPSLVLFVDAEGHGVGRNGSELMRGDDVGSVYPGLSASLKSGNTGSAFWVNQQRGEQLLASYAPVHDSSGEIVGVLVVGTPLNDGRLTRTSEVTSGRSLALVMGAGDKPIAIGGKKLKGFDSEEVSGAVASAKKGTLSHVTMAIEGYLFAAAPLNGFDGAVLVGSAPASKVASVDALLWPVFAVGLLGFFLVFTAGTMLGNYISKPISEIEEGLLLIMNGQQDLRFDLEHDELGGLTSQINGLLNNILGVPENQDEGGAG